jgi:hypothetical protein
MPRVLSGFQLENWVQGKLPGLKVALWLELRWKHLESGVRYWFSGISSLQNQFSYTIINFHG